MAKASIVSQPGSRAAVIVSSPAAPVGGDPIRYGVTTGLALLDKGEGGAAATETIVEFGPMLCNVVVDDNEGGGVVPGDPIYYHDTATGSPVSHLNNSALGADAFFGIAMETVGHNATTSIKVRHFESLLPETTP